MPNVSPLSEREDQLATNVMVLNRDRELLMHELAKISDQVRIHLRVVRALHQEEGDEKEEGGALREAIIGLLRVQLWLDVLSGRKVSDNLIKRAGTVATSDLMEPREAVLEDILRRGQDLAGAPQQV